MKIELTIKTTYLPNWGAWEGIRELVQNGRDAETEFNAPLAVSHQGQTLRIENEGATLPHEALLLGFTSKADRGDMIGKFGEGLKLGILALVRAGRPVIIRSGSEVWRPTIARSEKFNADVLVFDIQGGREPKSRVRVEIGGVTEVEWSELKSRFLFIGKAKKDSRVSTYGGTLLLGDENKGKVFVKGIFVQNHPKLEYGYDFVDCSVDRDRKMVNSWELEFHAQRVWREALNQRPDLLGRFMELVEDGKEDVKSLDATSASYLTDEIVNKAAELFIQRHGEDAIPVANLSECADIEHLGKRGVVVKPQLQAVLSKKIGSFETVKAKLKEEAVRSYSLSDLNEEEKASLDDARSLLVKAGVVQEGQFCLQVVDFRSDGLLGQYKGGEVLLARRILVDRDETLATLIHEVSHAHGLDGDKGHVAAIERAWTKVAGILRK